MVSPLEFENHHYATSTQRGNPRRSATKPPAVYAAARGKPRPRNRETVDPHRTAPDRGGRTLSLLKSDTDRRWCQPDPGDRAGRQRPKPGPVSGGRPRRNCPATGADQAAGPAAMDGCWPFRGRRALRGRPPGMPFGLEAKHPRLFTHPKAASVETRYCIGCAPRRRLSGSRSRSNSRGELSQARHR